MLGRNIPIATELLRGLRFISNFSSRGRRDGKGVWQKFAKPLFLFPIRYLNKFCFPKNKASKLSTCDKTDTIFFPRIYPECPNCPRAIKKDTIFKKFKHTFEHTMVCSNFGYERIIFDIKPEMPIFPFSGIIDADPFGFFDFTFRNLDLPIFDI